MAAFKVLARNGVVGAGLLCALSTGAAIGASAGDEPAPKPSAVEDGNLLAGPKVTGSAPSAGDAKEGMRRDTLIERDFEGHVKRVETHPAIAALELIGLSDEEKAATSRIIAERDAVLDRAVQAHLKDLVQASNAGQSGDEAGALAYLRPIIDDTSELRERGRLLDELAGAVSKEHAQRLRQLHDEYWRAIVDERMTLGNPRKPDKKLSRFEAGAFETVAGRMAKAADEISHWPEYDYVIVNTDVDKALADIQAILNAERLKRSRQTGISEFVGKLV